MLCWMCDKTVCNRIINKSIIERFGVARLVDKMVEIYLVGLTCRVKTFNERVYQIKDSQITRGRGRLIKILKGTIKKYLKVN